jgi:hypothetical protein
MPEASRFAIPPTLQPQKDNQLTHPPSEKLHALHRKILTRNALRDWKLVNRFMVLVRNKRSTNGQCGRN